MNIVLLQGPMGPFFQTLGNMLQQQGHRVYKICFNGGDECWPIKGTQIHYQNSLKHWSHFFSKFCHSHHIDSVICYGDCRSYHAQAAKVCRQSNRTFWVLEEGYLRPDFVTMEKGGVNANSQWYPLRHELPEFTPEQEFDLSYVASKNFCLRAWYATSYYITKYLKQNRYPYFVSHRPWSVFKEAGSWIKGGLIKLGHKKRDRRLLNNLQQHKGKVFLLPLQISEDFQIRCHSNYRSIETLISDVVDSFAVNACKDEVLLIKHHPMDRGFACYAKVIADLRYTYGLGARLVYGYELPLPEVFPLLKGVVTVNSTVGLSALLHQVPVKCLGRALYDIPKLTSAMSLSQFWKKPAEVCPQTFTAVCEALLHLTQINGCYFKDFHITAAKVAAKITAKVQGDNSESPQSMPLEDSHIQGNAIACKIPAATFPL